MTEKKKGARGRIRRAIAGAAPGLARALGGPLAGAAAEYVSRAIFGDAVTDDDALAEAVANASPEQIIALKQAELSFQKAVLATGVEEQRIASADRADARRRQSDMRDWTPSALGAAIIFGFFIVLGAMVSQRLPDGAETEFSIMLGALATMTAAVVNYFFGSSAGSKEKTRLMNGAPQALDGAAPEKRS